MSHRFTRSAFILAVMLGGAAWSGAAFAQAGSPADAARLFDEANALMDKKDFQTACPKLERVIQIVPEAAGARLALGECFEGLGKTASALRAYELAVVALAKANDRARLAKTEQKVSALAAKVATLTLELGVQASNAKGLVVTLEGSAVPRTELGTARKLDAGTYGVEASADSMRPFKASVTLADGEKKSVRVELEGQRADVQPEVTTLPQLPTAPDVSSATSYWGGQRIAAVVIGGVGVVGLGVGAALGVTAMSTLDESASSCNDETDICSSQTGIDLRDEAILQSHVSTVGFVAGGALLGLGAVLFFTADPDTTFGADEPPAPSVALRVRGTFLSVEGSLGSW